MLLDRKDQKVILVLRDLRVIPEQPELLVLKVIKAIPDHRDLKEIHLLIQILLLNNYKL